MSVHRAHVTASPPPDISSDFLLLHTSWLASVSDANLFSLSGRKKLAISSDLWKGLCVFSKALRFSTLKVLELH